MDRRAQDRRYRYRTDVPEGMPMESCCTEETPGISLYVPMSGRMTDILVGCDRADDCVDHMKEGRCILTVLKELDGEGYAKATTSIGM